MSQKLLIGISGKIGAGKNYLANSLQKELNKRGYTTAELAFGNALKDELTEFIQFFHTPIKNNINDQQKTSLLKKVSVEMNIPLDQVEYLFNLLCETMVQTNPGELDGFVKSEATRLSLQFLGTEIRRNQDENYWTNKTDKMLPDVDVIVIADARFVNEADYVKDRGGYLFRLEVPYDIIIARASARDKIRYSKAAESHHSETGLDDYKKFDTIVHETFDKKMLVDDFLKKNNQPTFNVKKH